jgi:hypothetical protein
MKIRTILTGLTLLGGLAGTATFAGAREVTVRDNQRVVDVREGNKTIEVRHDDRVVVNNDRDGFGRDDDRRDNDRRDGDRFIHRDFDHDHDAYIIRR